jgi:hypothetical protein
VEERRGRIEAVSGVYRAMLGKETTADSGVAINSLVEQGSTVLAEPNDNFRYSRRLVGEMLISFAKSDMLGKPTQVSVQKGSKKKVIYINREVMTPQGPVIQNDIASAQVKVVLEDIPATPSFRAQQLQSLSQMVQAAPPEYQAVLFPMMIELSDVPNRQAVAEQLRKVGNVPSMDPKDEAAQAQQAQQAMQMQQMAMQLNMQKLQAEVQKLQAEAAKIGADAQAEQQNIQLQAQIAKLKMQIEQADITLKAKAMDLQAIKIHADATLGAEKASIAERAQALDEKTAAAVLANPGAKSENQTRS